MRGGFSIMAEIDLEAEGKTLKLIYEISDIMVWCQVYFVKMV